MINLKGVSLIKKYESFKANPYICPAGKPTIGYGTTYYPNGVKVTMKDKPISEDVAVVYLCHEIEEKAKVLHTFLKSIGLQLNENEFSALIVFIYNLGLGPVIIGGKLLNIALKSRDRKKIAAAMLKYDKARVKNMFGARVLKTLPGLVARRKEEVELFTSPCA